MGGEGGGGRGGGAGGSAGETGARCTDRLVTLLEMFADSATTAIDIAVTLGVGLTAGSADAEPAGGGGGEGLAAADGTYADVGGGIMGEPATGVLRTVASFMARTRPARRRSLVQNESILKSTWSYEERKVSGKP